MAKVIAKNVRVKDLPPELTAGLDAAPDEVVWVTVDAERARRVETFVRLAHDLSEEARSKGLTEEKLAELLDGK